MASRVTCTPTRAELDRILAEGSQWAQREGFARQEDVEHTEERGRMAGADPERSARPPRNAGLDQVGTLGSGNHFAEIDVVSEVFDAEAANALSACGAGQVVFQIHCGSRGLGHQVATDYIQEFQPASKRFGYELPDRQLVCAPLDSPEGRNYLAAMNCAANYAWANRQVLSYRAREAFEEVLRGNVARSGPVPGLRRGAQYGQGRAAPDWAGKRPLCVSTAREPRVPSDRGIRPCRQTTVRSASRCSYPAAWAQPLTCCLARRQAWSTHLAPAATAQGEC